MAEKMYSFTHAISESKLLALLTQHADEVRIDIIEPQKRAYQRKLNGAPTPLMLEGPPKRQAKPAPGQEPPKPMRRGATGKKSLPHLVLEHLADNKARVVTTAELEKTAKQHKKSPHAISVAMTSFLKKGYVERVGKGEYKILKEGLAKVAASAANADPKKTPKPKQTGVGRGHYKRSAVSGHDLIWPEFVKGEPVKAESFRAAFVENGLKSNSVSNVFSRLTSQGLANRLGDGMYQITKKGLELHATQTAAEAAPSNT